MVQMAGGRGKYAKYTNTHTYSAQELRTIEMRREEKKDAKSDKSPEQEDEGKKKISTK